MPPEAGPDEMRALLAAHDSTLRVAVEANGGWLANSTVDGICAVFASACAAIAVGSMPSVGCCCPSAWA